MREFQVVWQRITEGCVFIEAEDEDSAVEAVESMDAYDLDVDSEEFEVVDVYDLDVGSD